MFWSSAKHHSYWTVVLNLANIKGTKGHDGAESFVFRSYTMYGLLNQDVSIGLFYSRMGLTVNAKISEQKHATNFLWLQKHSLYKL